MDYGNIKLALTVSESEMLKLDLVGSSSGVVNFLDVFYRHCLSLLAVSTSGSP